MKLELHSTGYAHELASGHSGGLTLVEVVEQRMAWASEM